MTVSEEVLRDGMDLVDVAAEMSCVARSVAFDVDVSVDVVVAGLVMSSGVFWHASGGEGDVVPAYAGWLCDGEAPSGPTPLVGELSAGMGSSMAALWASCGVADPAGLDVESGVVSALEDALMAGVVSSSDVVVLGSAVASGLLSEHCLGSALTRSSDDAFDMRGLSVMCGRMLGHGADASWAASFLEAVVRGDVSMSLVDDFLSAYEAGRLSSRMLSDYAADVEVGSASWDNLCVVVRGRSEMCRLGR